MARIGFDARMLDRTGIGTYIGELLPRLAQSLRSDDALTVFGSKTDTDRIVPALRSTDTLCPVPARIYGPEEQLSLPRRYAQARLDLLHANSPDLRAHHAEDR